MLLIQPWDKSVMASIEKAVLKSDLGLTPNNDGIVIRLAIPQLTQERRNELVKSAKKKAEDARVAVRNIRRDANDHLKALKKEKQISQEDIQKLTDKYVKEIDHILENKEQEILEV